jgi:hypothetical protein
MFYGGFVWAHRALTSQKRRFPAWAVTREESHKGSLATLIKRVGDMVKQVVEDQVRLERLRTMPLVYLYAHYQVSDESELL